MTYTKTRGLDPTPCVCGHNQSFHIAPRLTDDDKCLVNTCLRCECLSFTLPETPNKAAPFCPGCDVAMQFVGRDINTHDGQVFDVSTYKCSQGCGKCLGMQVQNHMNQDGTLIPNYKPEIAP